MPSLLRPIVLLAILVSIGLTLGLKLGDPPAVEMRTFAGAFVETLDKADKKLVLLPYDAANRVDWHFIPKDSRKGLPLKEMNDAQSSAALRLLRSALSDVGYRKADRIMLLEEVLQGMEGEGRRWARDSQLYYVTLFGYEAAATDASQPWGLSFEGHHLSLNFVCKGDQVVDSTPQFMGSNPATIMNETGVTLDKGTAVLAREENLAFELLGSLTESQRKKAILSDKAPKDIRFAGDAQASVGEPEGLPFSALSPDQKATLKRLVDVYVEVPADTVARRRRELLEKDGWDPIHFAWAGADKPGVGHYYRIRGKGFLIEYANTQADPAGNPANHAHAFFRDLTGDFDLPAHGG
ncbi:MAG: DUF3500 domain-containing protein [Planctomycetota bacterium]